MNRETLSSTQQSHINCIVIRINTEEYWIDISIENRFYQIVQKSSKSSKTEGKCNAVILI